MPTDPTTSSITYNNPYIDALVGPTVFRPGIAIEYTLQAPGGTFSAINDGGQVWRSSGGNFGFSQAVAAWTAVCGIQVTQYPTYYNGSGNIAGKDGVIWIEQIIAGGTGSGGSIELGTHYLPGPAQQIGTYNSNYAGFNFPSNQPGGMGFLTFLHEIGHALGLEHPFDTSERFPGVPEGDETSIGDHGLNQALFTVMSYNDYYRQIGPPPGFNYGWQKTPGAFDIAAVQALYGPNLATGAGDTVYTLPDKNVEGTGFACIWDSGGIDTIDGHSAVGLSIIDLRAATLQDEYGGGGFLSHVTGVYGGFTIANGAVIENAIGGSGVDYLTGNDAANRLDGSLGLEDTLNGGAGDDTLIGGTGQNTLDGGDGNDTLIGGTGYNFFDGGTGNDIYYGGPNGNSYVVDSIGDVIFEPATEHDRVSSSASYYLWANLGSLTLLEDSHALFGVGNDQNNTIFGNSFDNLLIGGDGDDTLYGGAGNDQLFGETGNDALYGEDGTDYLVGGDGNDLLDGGYGPDALYGGDGNDGLLGGPDFATDILVGGAGDDTLVADSGLGDYDLLYGGTGNDIYYVDTPADLTFENPGEGTDTVIAYIVGAGYYLYANIENLTLGAQTPFGVGNELDNILIGSNQSNWLLGGAGDDRIDGGGGNDVLFGEAGADTFILNHANEGAYAGDIVGSGQDVIGDFQPGIDRIELVGQGFTSFDQLQAAFVENGGTTAIDLGNGDFVVLNGVPNAALTAPDFIFG